MDTAGESKVVNLTLTYDEAVTLKVVLGKVVGRELKDEMIEEGFSVKTASLVSELSYDLYEKVYNMVEENFGGGP